MESQNKIGLIASQTPPLTSITQTPSPSPSSSGGIVKKLMTVFSFLTITVTIIGGIFAALKSKLSAAGALLGQVLSKFNTGSLLPHKLKGDGGGKFRSKNKTNLRTPSYTPKQRGGGIGMASYEKKRKKKGIRKILRFF